MPETPEVQVSPSPLERLYDIRGKLQNLIEHNVSVEFIFNTLVEELKSNLDDQFHKEIDTLKMKYNINSKDLEQGKSDDDAVKKIVHQFMKVEEFIAKFMSWYKHSVGQGAVTVSGKEHLQGT